MPLVATAAANWNEDDETKRLIATLQQIIGERFGPQDADLIRDVQYITDRDRLHQLIELSLTVTHFADIQAAIESAVSPPK